MSAVGVPSGERLTKDHVRRQAWLVGLVIAVAIPVSLATWITVGRVRNWEPIHTARVANVGGRRTWWPVSWAGWSGWAPG